MAVKVTRFDSFHVFRVELREKFVFSVHMIAQSLMDE